MVENTIITIDDVLDTFDVNRGRSGREIYSLYNKVMSMNGYDNEIARELELPFSTVRQWRTGLNKGKGMVKTVPHCVKTVQRLTRAGFLPISYDSPLVEPICNLASVVYLSGRVNRSKDDSKLLVDISTRNEDEKKYVSELLETMNIPFRYIVGREGIAISDGASDIGRVLVGMGLPIERKSNIIEVHIPKFVMDAYDSNRLNIVKIFLDNLMKLRHTQINGRSAYSVHLFSFKEKKFAEDYISQLEKFFNSVYPEINIRTYLTKNARGINSAIHLDGVQNGN